MLRAIRVIRRKPLRLAALQCNQRIGAVHISDLRG